MVSWKDIAVNLFVQEARDEIDLEWKWRNPVSDEEVLKYEKMGTSKRKKGVFEPFEQ